jgi:hypothetical protein
LLTVRVCAQYTKVLLVSMPFHASGDLQQTNTAIPLSSSLLTIVSLVPPMRMAIFVLPKQAPIS